MSSGRQVMEDINAVSEALTRLGLEVIVPGVRELWAETFGPSRHGDFDRWWQAVNALPPQRPVSIDLQSAVSLTFDAPLSPEVRSTLMALHPWRKGPFHLGECVIDTEWRSDWKWNRVVAHLGDLTGRRVLDVGCGSGYHLWRMRGAGAHAVVGIDPSPLFFCQFHALQHFIRDDHVQWIPATLERFPAATHAFDTVFSMGVLYHRRSPLDHVSELKAQLRPGGQLVLETLVVEGDASTVFTPPGRYAQMGNVWFIPSVDATLGWLRKLGFSNPRCVDVTLTTTEEQRSTAWMTSRSLADFLDPKDRSRTVEGHPAPLRAVLLAEV